MNLPILEKVLKDLAKKKTVIFIILLQLFLVLALGMVLKNIGILFEPKNILVRPIPIGVIGSPDLYDVLSKESAISISAFSDESLARQAFVDGRIDGYIISEEGSLPHSVHLVLPKGDIRSSIIISLLKPHLDQQEDILRRKFAPQRHALYLSDFLLLQKTDASSSKIFEILYAIVVPFFLLLPGILLSSMLIDILVEDMDKKTLPIVLMRITPARYLTELGLGVILFSMIQVVIWLALLSTRNVILARPLNILWVVFLCTSAFYLISALITLSFPNKTKAQLMYSFLLIFVFASIGLSEMHPLRLITAHALGLAAPPIFMVTIVYTAIICSFILFTHYLSDRMKA